MLTEQTRTRERTARVLVVDVDADVVAGLRRTLESLDHTWDIRYTTNPGHALRALAERPVDLVVTGPGVELPDGRPLVEVVCRDFPSTARLVCTETPRDAEVFENLLVANQLVVTPCDAATLAEAIARALWMRDRLTTAKLNVAAVTSLPLLPSTPGEVRRELDSPRMSGRAMARVIQRDPALVAKVLQIVSSSFYGRGASVTDLGEAAAMLGRHTLRTIVDTERTFSDSELSVHFPSSWIQDVATHSIETARLAGWMARDTPFAQDAFCAGLLVDVGQLVIACCRPQAYGIVQSVWREGDDALAVIEQATFGITHATAGAHLLALWGLPETVIDAVERHGDTDLPGELSATTYVASAHAVVEQRRRRVCGAPTQDLDLRIDPRLRAMAAEWGTYQLDGRA